MEDLPINNIKDDNFLLKVKMNFSCGYVCLKKKL